MPLSYQYLQSELGQGPDGRLVECTHEGYLGAVGVTQPVDSVAGWNEVLCRVHVGSFRLLNSLFHQLFGGIGLLWRGGGRGRGAW